MGVFGLVLTAVASGAAVVIGHVVPEPPPARLIRAVRIVESLLLAISLLALAVVAVLWARCQLKHADLHAERAEAASGLHARVANAP
jgi:H+/gluconate symporter-like permease